MKWSTLWVVAFALIASGCMSTNQATGERQLSFVSPEQEAQIGADEHPKVMAQFGGAYTARPNITQYVNTIGRNLAAVSEQPQGKWTFTVLNSPVVNAFALPGGYVYVSRGLMALANSEAELAGVIGHEIGHVTARHGATRMTRGQLVTVGASLLEAVVGAATGISGAGQLAGLAGQAYVASYSRDQEFQADELGVRYLGRGGYDKEAQSRFLASLAANTNLTMKIAGKDDKMRQFDFFATHPNTPDRVVRALELARASGVTGGRVARNAYLRQIDGMLYGDDPKEGFVMGQRFIHPELDIRFALPDNYRIVNTPTAVRGVGQGRSVIFDGDRLPRGISLVGYVQDTWLGQKNVTPQNVNSVRINGFRVIKAEAPVSVNGTPTYAYFAAIRHSPERVYRFILLERGAERGAGVRDFNAILKSFGRVRQADRNQLRVKRLKVVTVQRGDTISGLARKMAVDQYKEQHFRVLNGIREGDILQAGQLVKLVVATRN